VPSLTKPVALVFIADSCIYKKVCPFNGGSFLLQPSASDFQFCWNQAPYAIGKKNLYCGSVPLADPTCRAWSPGNNWNFLASYWGLGHLSRSLLLDNLMLPF
jgi:hypothetical protein